MFSSITLFHNVTLQESCPVAGKLRDAAVNFDTMCVGSSFRSILLVAFHFMMKSIIDVDIELINVYKRLLKL